MWNRLVEFVTGNGRKKENSLWSVLVIEDNPVDRTLIEKTLLKAGFRVLLARDGETGLHIVQAEKPDLILMDYELPGKNGAEICRELKDDESTRPIPVIFLLGSDTSKNVIDCFDVDAETYFLKPIKPRLFISQITEILRDYAEESRSA